MNTILSHLDQQGVVIKKTIGHYTVLINDRMIECELSSQLRKELVYSTPKHGSGRQTVKEVKSVDHTDPVVVGDRVQIEEISPRRGLIRDVLPRRNRLARRSPVPMPGAHSFEQVIVSNVDQVIPVFSAARPTPHWNLLDRYLVAAESEEIIPLICITKIDLAKDENGNLTKELEEALKVYRRIGYPVILTSSTNGEGVEDLKKSLKNRVSVFVGKSGVGKSSLLNAIQPGLGLRVNEVNEKTGKGRHTTTHMEMIALETGGSIVDTPGEREFGLWGVHQDDLAMYFREMRPLIGQCKFGMDCRHEEEPGCAIRKAVMNGGIHPHRYQSYIKLKDDGFTT